MLAHYGAPDPQRLVADCEHRLEQALALEPELAMGLSARAALRFFFKGDLDGAAKDSQRALAQLPSRRLAMVWMANLVRSSTSSPRRRRLEQALLIDRLDVGLNMNFGDHMILQRRFDAAVRALRKALEFAPRHRPCQLRACWALALDGRPDEAQALLASLGPNGADDLPWLKFAALVAEAAGDQPGALRHFEALERLAQRRDVPPGRWRVLPPPRNDSMPQSVSSRRPRGNGRARCPSCC